MKKIFLILVLFVSLDSNCYAEEQNTISKVYNVLERRWPTFKARCGNFIELSRHALASAISVSKSNFDKNFRTLISNTIFLNKLEISGNKLVTSEQATKATELESGAWLWKIDLNQATKNIEQIAWVKSADTEISIFPAKLKIAIEEHKPWMLAEFSKRLWIVSEHGTLISPVAELKNVEILRSLRSMPRLIGLSEWDEQTYLKSENARYHHAIKSLKFIEEAGGMPYRLGLIKLLKDGALQISAAEKSKSYPDIIIAISSVEEAKIKIKTLMSVIKDLENRNEQAATIDLRFEDRAIVN